MSITHELIKSELAKLPPSLCNEVKAKDNGKKFSLLMLKKLSGYKASEMKLSYSEGGGDHQVDSVYFVDEGDNLQVHIMSCKFSTNGSLFPDQDVTDFLHVGVRFLLLGEMNANDLNTNLKRLREEIVERLTDHENKATFMLKFIASSENVLSSNGDSAVNMFCVELQKHGFDIQYEEFNLQRLSGIFSKRTVLSSLVPIKLSGRSYYSLVGRDGFVCRLPVSELVNVYYGFKSGDKEYPGYGDFLFTDNVRKSFGLGADKKINQAIYESASNAELAGDFEYYNNGLTIIYQDKLGNLTGDSPVLFVKGLRVVNGCQTVSTLMKAHEDAKLCEDVYVTCRFLKEDEDREFVRSVTKYTNSQNPITARDLHSNDTIQFDIQGILEKVGIFYERQLNEFRDLDDEKRLDALFAAQAYLCCESAQPQNAKQDKRKLFTDYYEKIFDPSKDDLAYKLLASARTLDYALEKQLAARRKKRKVKKEGRSPRYRVQDHVIAHGSYHVAALLYRRLYGAATTDQLKTVAKGGSYIKRLDKAYDAVVKSISKYIENARLPKENIPQFFKDNDISLLGEL